MTKIKSNHIDILRDIAISLEVENKQISTDLMALALKNRPTGLTLQKKLKEYSSICTPSSDVIPSLLMALELVKGSTSFYSLLECCLAIYSDNDIFLKVKKDNNLILELKSEVLTLQSQVELLRNKFNLMHKALCYSDAFKIREIDDHAAKLSPVEFFDKGSKKTLIVFGGMATIPSMPPKEFFASFREKNINIIYVKDFQQCWYQNGLMGLTDDIQSTVDYLKSLIPSRTNKLACLGTSAGGYASIRIGVELNAERILAFSPQTKINKPVFNKFKSLDSRRDEINLNNEINLSNFLKTSNYKGKIDLYYGKLNKADKNAAENISSYVNLHSYSTDKHSIATFLKSKGLLSDILNSI